MGSLENALLLARTVGETVTRVQGPRDVFFLSEKIREEWQRLDAQGPKDLWWEGVTELYEDCMKHAPQDCLTLAEYAQWAENMVRLWHTLLSAREMIVAWAGRSSDALETKISPNADLIRVRDIVPANDCPKGLTSFRIETIGNETLQALRERGIDCFESWDAAKYRSRLCFSLSQDQTKILHHESNSSLVCGFYKWIRRKPPSSLLSAIPKVRTIGQESLRTRTLWAEEIAPERVGFRRLMGEGITSINEDEGALRIALDLMKVSVRTKLPLILPPQKKTEGTYVI